MPKCSVVGCGSSKKENQKSLSLHRLPKSENIRKKWLEAIGTENLRPNVKDIYICSLHFHKSAFNTTLDVIRLRDGAIPLQSHRKPSSDQNETESISMDLPKENIEQENIPEKTPSAEKVLNLLPVESCDEIILIKVQPVASTSGESGVPLVSLEKILIKKLEQRCVTLKRKVKALNEKVRRQKKKIENYKNIIKDLQEKKK